ncbi:disintegrin and metalloproteinase domain-containing protein 21-like [Centrocercus urophasianus]|uniref:disintegrin and metalloproteinase domain-containing protein 21-like n=1 Tax=Centrocercus urophasianus TaxID=9002 RepID=UPI001C6462AA|nr:disintegrin and metalloproteinase domain-containing protein 21-like [Centrocercus urophasianus]
MVRDQGDLPTLGIFPMPRGGSSAHSRGLEADDFKVLPTQGIRPCSSLSVCLSVHLRNILCGRVQCTNIKRVPVRQDGETVVQTFLNNQLCWGLEFHLPFDTPDDGSVKDGTSCGTNKICINRTCVSAAFLSSVCTARKCHGKGVCNNKNNCHCDLGWAPPDCRAKGFGGSVDSGPPPSYYAYGAAVKAAGTLLLLSLILGVLLYKRADIAGYIRRWRHQRRDRRNNPTPPPPELVSTAPTSIKTNALEEGGLGNSSSWLLSSHLCSFPAILAPPVLPVRAER